MGLLNLFKAKPNMNRVYTLSQAMALAEDYGNDYDFPYDESKNGFVAIQRTNANNLSSRIRNSNVQEFRNNLSNNGEYKGKDVEVSRKHTQARRYGYINYENKQYGRYNNR